MTWHVGIRWGGGELTPPYTPPATCANWQFRLNSVWAGHTPVQYMSGLFSAVSSSESVRYSPDGYNWSSSPVPAITGFLARGFANNDDSVFVMPGGAGSWSIYSSPDFGVSWTNHQSLPGLEFPIDVMSNGSSFVVPIQNNPLLTGPALYSSPDGVTWTERLVAPGAIAFWGTTDPATGTYYLPYKSHDTASSVVVAYSNDDGVTWAPLPTLPDPTLTSGLIRSWFDTTDNRLFVARTVTGGSPVSNLWSIEIGSSSWETHATPPGSYTISQIYRAGNVYLMAREGSSGLLIPYYSYDAQSWFPINASVYTTRGFASDGTVLVSTDNFDVFTSEMSCMFPDS